MHSQQQPECLSRQIWLVLLLSAIPCVINAAESNEVGEAASTTVNYNGVQVVAELNVHVEVKNTGLKFPRGGDVKCGRVLRKAPKQKGVNQTFFLYNDPIVSEILQGESHEIVPFADSQRFWGLRGQGQNHESNERSPDTKQPSYGFRRLSVSNNSQGNVAKRRVSVTLDDYVKKYEDTSKKTSCWRHKTSMEPENDLLFGSLEVSVPLAETAQFYKVDIDAEDGVFARPETSSRLEGAIHPFLRSSLIKDGVTFIWVDHRTAKGRLRLKYEVDNLRFGVPFDGKQTYRSQLQVTFSPLASPSERLPFEDHVDSVLSMLEENSTSEEDLILALSSLYRSDDEYGPILSSMHLSHIRELQTELFEFAIRATHPHQGFTPFTKAMAAVIATRVAEELSELLLPLCENEIRELPLTGREVTLPKYVYLTFYLQRIVNRLNGYRPSDHYAIVEALVHVERSGVTYASASDDTSLMSTLARAYDGFLAIDSELRRPVVVSAAELEDLLSTVTNFTAVDQTIMAAHRQLKNAANLESRLLSGIHEQRREFTQRAPDMPVRAAHLQELLEELGDQVTETMASLQDAVASELFGELDSSHFRGSLIAILEGVSLFSRSTDEDAEGAAVDSSVASYYDPIFAYFFDRAELKQTAEKVTRCLTEGLKSE